MRDWKPIAAESESAAASCLQQDNDTPIAVGVSPSSEPIIMRTPRRPMKRKRPDDARPQGVLYGRMHDPDLQAKIRFAEVIIGVDPKGGGHTGPYYGLAALKRVVRRGEAEALRTATIPVDPDTDDVEVLCAMVKVLKGAHCYNSFVPGDKDR